MFPFINALAPIVFLLSLVLISCAGTPPIKEYAIAKQALISAKKHKSHIYFPQRYKNAIKLYKKGTSSFKDRYYGQARNYFEEVIEQGEQAENLTRINRGKRGDFDL